MTDKPRKGWISQTMADLAAGHSGREKLRDIVADLHKD
jgi:hypothetical protein